VSRDEGQRFRVTVWPGLVELPDLVAAPPGLVAVGDWIDEALEEEQRWVELGPLEPRFVTLERQPTDWFEEPGHEPLERIHIDKTFQAEHPGCEDFLYKTANELDNPPSLLFESGPTELMPLPDELFMREFLKVDVSVDADVIAFLERWGPLDLPDPWTATGTVTLVPKAWMDYARAVGEGVPSVT